MLTTKKSTTLTGTSKVTHNGNEVVAVSMTANIAEAGNSNVTKTIVNQEAYEANKAACREDMDAFEVEVRNIEDAE